MTTATKKWPPLDLGTRVKTTSKKTADREWMPEALVARKWGVTGRIIMHHDSHGLCYDVRHDDGTEGCYDPNEFDVLSEVQLENVVIREVENALKQYAVFRMPGRVLVGIEQDGFTVIQLAKEYGSGTYVIDLFKGNKLEASYHQVVDDRLGSPKKTEPMSEGALPSAI